jgi:hypothetical protein
MKMRSRTAVATHLLKCMVPTETGTRPGEKKSPPRAEVGKAVKLGSKHRPYSITIRMEAHE